MKKRYAILLSAVLALAFSCAKEQGTDVVKQKMTFRVNAEGATIRSRPPLLAVQWNSAVAPPQPKFTMY